MVHVSDETYRLGGATASVAANLSALGARVALVGVIGTDLMGAKVKELLKEKGIDTSYLVEDPSRPTIQKTRIIAQHQQVVRVDHEKQAWLDSKTREALWTRPWPRPGRQRHPLQRLRQGRAHGRRSRPSSSSWAAPRAA